MSFCIDDEKLLEKYKAIWTKIEDFKNIELNPLSVSYERYEKAKIKTQWQSRSTSKNIQVCTNFRGLNLPEEDTECESFTVISIACKYI